MKIHLPRIILYVVLLLAVFAAQQRLTNPGALFVTPHHGMADLSALDLSRDTARIVEKEWEYYPRRLYTPGDFARGSVDAPFFDDSARAADYGTYRLTLKLPSRRIYAMTGRSFSFSQKVFIDGRPVDAVGVPGTTRADTVPRTRTYDYHFAVDGDETEIVFQVANFHHREGGRNNSFQVAEPPVVSRHRALEFIRANVVVGCLVTVFFYFLGMFIFFSRRPHFLFFALACLATAGRAMLMGEKHAMAIFPDLSWFVAIRLEYAFLILFVVFLQLYFAALYPGMIPRGFVAAVTGLSALYGLTVLFGDTLLFTRLLKCYTLVWASASAVTLWKMVLRVRRGDMQTVLIFAGLMVFVATAVFDEVAYRFFFHVRLHNTLVAGMLVCVFMNMIALTLGFSESERELALAKIRQRELDETNRLLDRLSAMKTRFMSNISHEMKTPLTVMSVHAQLSKALLAAGAGHGEIRRSLDLIARESGRLARMVDGVLDLGGLQETRNGMEALDLGLLLRKCGEAYRAIFEKRGNALTLDIPDGLPRVRGNADMLTQVAFNLFSNANRHTGGGRIALSAKAEDGWIKAALRDTGEGVQPDILPRVFERRVHGDGDEGSGLGLAICRSVLQRHGGSIAIESARGEGTTVAFALPIMTGEEA